ncbi:hypothetical protein F2Q68_00036126 [Brassica cretica]|uniref:Uncharacterized protein n=1 Tax=Brassica cretica TaxID=69181 RepID=A0A8S9H7Q7_BRACR|nr:hypothetical protein F2Q68_00036126 [Brassica cretica]
MCLLDGEKCDKGATLTVLCGTRRAGMVETGTGLWREYCEFTSYGMMIRIWVGFVGGVDMDEFLARFMFLFHFDL